VSGVPDDVDAMQAMREVRMHASSRRWLRQSRVDEVGARRKKKEEERHEDH